MLLQQKRQQRREHRFPANVLTEDLTRVRTVSGRPERSDEISRGELILVGRFCGLLLSVGGFWLPFSLRRKRYRGAVEQRQRNHFLPGLSAHVRAFAGRPPAGET